MPQLTIVEVPHGAAQAAACDALARDLVGAGVRVARIAASEDAATRTLRRLADAGTPALGVQTCAIDTWARGRWELFGDGRALVGTAQRRALAMLALAQTPGNLLRRETAGMVGCIERVLREGAGARPFELAVQGAHTGAALSAAERELLDMCAFYLRELDTRRLVEPGRAWQALPAAMGDAGWSHLLLDGVLDLTQAQVDLVAKAAAHQGATYVARLGANPAFAPARHLAARLEQACAQRGVAVVRLDLGAADKLDLQPVRDRGLEQLAQAAKAGFAPLWRAPELEELAAALFAPVHGDPVDPMGCVRFCLPSGRYAEPELLAKTIQKLVYDGYAPRSIAVACTDPLATAQLAAGRLAQTPGRAVACLAHGSAPLAQTSVGRALACLVELAGCADPGKPAPELRTVASDLARNPLAGIGPAAATRLDGAWRGKRATGARDYLKDLAQAADAAAGTQDAGAAEGPSPLARTIELVARNDVAEAAKVLGAQAAGVGVTACTERAAAAEAARLALAYRETGAGSPNAQAWNTLIAGARVPLHWASVPASDVAAQRSAAVMDSNPNAVQFVRMHELEGRSFSAVVLCDLTADAYSVATRSDARTTLWEKLGIDAGPQRIDEMRWQFRCALEAARDVLVLERRLQDEDAKDLRPAALLEELVDCYRADPTELGGLDRVTGLPADGSLPCDTLGEEGFASLAAPVTLAPATLEAPLPALVPGKPESRSLLIREGQLWSPSALELYLRCPLRWFHERRLPNEGLDASFGALELGTFAHRVLQVFHERLPRLGVERIDPQTPANLWEPLFEACFDEVLAAQDRDRNPLVPINALEREKVEAARRGLRTCVARDAQLPAGFVPRRHEWSFGTGDVPAIEYGSVLLRGTVDRIDEDAQGRALVIDYKGGLGAGGYEPPRPKKGQDPDEVDPLPLHSQALMYAGALRRAEGREVAGALYISYAKAAAAGFLDTGVVGHLDPDKGAYLGERCAVHPAFDGSSGFVQLLDHVEGEVADAMDRLRDGDVGPNPRFGARSCALCSVAGCPRRAGT